MNTTKNQQFTGLILGIVSVGLPNVANAIPTENEDTAVISLIAIFGICVAALVCGIIGISKSAGARKAATEVGEPKVVGTIGLVVSVIGTVYAALIFFLVGVCVACVACAATAALAS